MFDYHVHSEFSVDCDEPVARSCEAAIARGVTEIAFTDHIDHQSADPGTGYYRAKDYFASIDRAREQFGSRLTVLAGAEVDFHTDIVQDVSAFIHQWGNAYDFVIGSVHYAANGALIYPSYYADRSLDDVMLPYLAQVEEAVQTGWFDTIGHLDIPKRYLPKARRDYDPMRYRERWRSLFVTMIDQGVAFEINTSGIRQAPKTSLPGPAIVSLYAEAGGTRITTGTDSHAAKTVGAGLPETLAMLEVCGINNVQSFRGRVSTPVPIATLLPPL